MTRTPPFDRLITQRGAPATLYAADGTTGALSVSVIVSSVRSQPILGARGDVVAGHVASTVTVQPGQVLTVPVLPSVWYLVAKVLQVTRGTLFDPGTSLLMLTLSYQVTTRRATRSGTTVQPSALDGWDEPVGLTGGGTVNEQEDTATVRAGFSNQADPLSLAVEGVLPAGSTTMYAPLGASIRKGDEVRAADVRDASGGVLPTTALPPLEAAYTVTQVNHLFADGTPYALQALLSNAAGSGT